MAEFVSPWPAVGDQLDAMYPKEYLFKHGYEQDHYLELLIPQETWTGPEGAVDIREGKFFGTKVQTIFIAQMPYGWEKDGDTWTFRWANMTSAYSLKVQEYVERWGAIRDRFPYFECLIYGDLYTATEIQRRHPGSDMPHMMRRTITKLQQTCLLMPGFTYAGTITTQVEANFFRDTYQNFFVPTAYKLGQPQP